MKNYLSKDYDLENSNVEIVNHKLIEKIFDDIKTVNAILKIGQILV